MANTLTVTEEMADQLKPYEAELPEILELGLREWQSRRQSGYSGLNSVLETLAALPPPEEVLALRPTAQLQVRLGELLEANRTGSWSPADHREWDRYEYAEHFVRMAKISAARKLQPTAS